MPLKKQSNIPNLEDVAFKIKKTLPRIIGQMALRHFLLGFRKGGFQTDASSSGWQQRKKKTKKRRRAILVKTGALRRDLDIRKTTFNEIVIGTQDTIYASVHNDGETINRRRKNGTQYNVKMPKREFLGRSRKLDIRVQNKIKKTLKELLK